MEYCLSLISKYARGSHCSCRLWKSRLVLLRAVPWKWIVVSVLSWLLWVFHYLLCRLLNSTHSTPVLEYQSQWKPVKGNCNRRLTILDKFGADIADSWVLAQLQLAKCCDWLFQCWWCSFWTMFQSLLLTVHCGGEWLAALCTILVKSWHLSLVVKSQNNVMILASVVQISRVSTHPGSPGYFSWIFQALASPGKSVWSWKVL